MWTGVRMYVLALCLASRGVVEMEKIGDSAKGVGFIYIF
jgi:hypothetical protein